jgi:hypothetical protein
LLHGKQPSASSHHGVSAVISNCGRLVAADAAAVIEAAAAAGVTRVAEQEGFCGVDVKDCNLSLVAPDEAPHELEFGGVCSRHVSPTRANHALPRPLQIVHHGILPGNVHNPLYIAVEPSALEHGREHER